MNSESEAKMWKFIEKHERLLWTLGCLFVGAMAILSMSKNPDFNLGQAFTVIFVGTIVWGFVFFLAIPPGNDKSD